MKKFYGWTTTKRLEEMGYEIKERKDGYFEIWKKWKLIATVKNEGLWQFWKEAKFKPNPNFGEVERVN